MRPDWRGKRLLESGNMVNKPPLSKIPASEDTSEGTHSPAEIGRRVREHRQAAGLTLAALAQGAGFGKAYLSRIENGKKVPPIGTLARIAEVLGIEAASLLAKPGTEAVDWRGISLVRKSEKRETVMGGSAFGYNYFALTNATQGRALQPFLFTFPAEVDKFVFFQHEGEEMLHVLTGRIEWQVGMDKYILEPGDTLHFDSRMPHRGHSLSGPATALVVMYSAPGNEADLA